MKIKELLEARVPGLEYKEELAKDVIDKVILTLEGKDSEKFTKLAKRFKILDDTIKEASEAQEKIKDDIKSQGLALFDAEDIILTKVIETASATFNLSKRTPAHTVVSYDTEMILNELIKLLDKDLIKKVDELKELYKITKNVKEQDPALRVKLKEPKGKKVTEASEGGVMSKLRGFAEKYLGLTKKWEESYDQKMARLTAEIDRINPLPVVETKEKICEKCTSKKCKGCK